MEGLIPHLILFMPQSEPSWQLTIQLMEQHSTAIITFCWTFAAAVSASILYNWTVKEDKKLGLGESAQYSFVCLVFGNLLTMLIAHWVKLEPVPRIGLAGFLTLCGFNLALYAFRKSIDPKRTYTEWKNLREEDDYNDNTHHERTIE